VKLWGTPCAFIVPCHPTQLLHGCLVCPSTGAGENVEFRAFSKKLLIQGCVCGAAGSAAALIGSSALPLGFASSSLKHLEAKPCSHGLYEDVFDSVCRVLQLWVWVVTRR